MSPDTNLPIPHFELFTDGACSGNPGPGGWAYILRNVSNGGEQENTGGEVSSTNNRMELLSVINGLSSLDQPSRVDLYSDSQYVVKGLTEWMDDWIERGWRGSNKKVVKNLELWQKLEKLRDYHELSCHWVRGHDNHPENERCDQLAVEACERFKASQ